MKSSFTLSLLDNINLRKYNFSLCSLKPKIKKMLEIILNTDELRSSRIFCENISKIRFDIAFCTDNTIQEINREYRKKDKPTDVITFSLFVDDINSIPVRKTADLGQIIISAQRADEQKDENKNTIMREVLILICHGILHLFGFDHLTKKDYDFVVGIQNKVLKKLKDYE